MHAIYLRAFFGLSLCLFSLADGAFAQSETVFDRVRDAYQVDRLNAAKTIRLEEDQRVEFPAHDYGPDYHDMSFQRMHYVLDIENQRGSSEYLAEITSTFFHNRRILKNGKSMRLLYGPDIYIDEGERSFISEYGRTIRAYDPLLAMWLVKSAQTATIEDDEIWMGMPHDKVTVDFPESQPLTILVDKKTGYITKMTRIAGTNTKVSYTFDRHEIQNGITIATEANVFAGRDNLAYTFGRHIILDDGDDLAVFEMDAGMRPEPKRIDQSSATIEQISETTYHAGQGVAYSTFIRTGDGLLAFGLAEGFSGRLEAYRLETGDKSPLRYAVAPDHHQIELVGASEAAQIGATLFITADAVTRTKIVTEGLSDVKVEIINAPRQVGTVRILPLSTSHASNILVAYHEKDQTLVQQGNWVKWFEVEPVWADISDLTLYEALRPYNLPVEKLLSTDGRGTGNWETFVSQVKNYKLITCHRERPICDNWR